MFMFEQKLKRIALNEFKEAYNWNGNFIIFENLKSVYMFYNSNDEVIYIGGLKKLNKIKYMKQLNEDWFIREVVKVRCFVFSPEENIDDHVLVDLVTMLKTKMAPHRNKRLSSEHVYRYVESAANKLLELSDKKITGDVEYYDFKSIRDLNKKFVHHMILSLNGNDNLEIDCKLCDVLKFSNPWGYTYDSNEQLNMMAGLYNVPKRWLKRRIDRLNKTISDTMESMFEEPDEEWLKEMFGITKN